MKYIIQFLIVYVVNTFVNCDGPVYYEPEQVHISLGADPSQMIVTWVTLNSTKSSIVEYGTTDLTFAAKGTENSFTDGGKEKRMIYVHSVTLTDLIPGTKYVYHVGSNFAWSSLFSFTAMKAGSNWSPRFAVFGDMGNVNGQSIGRLQEETQAGKYDAILHVGDFAYDMDSDNARVGDAFMNQVQAIAAYIPYMTCPGNHENAYNFSNYKARLNMPGDGAKNMFYSINIGPVHLVSFTSEFYYYPIYGVHQIYEQYKWLEQDLIEANRPQNRKRQPWIISMCHRPMYCSNSNDDEHCPNLHGNTIRIGVENLLYKYGVDIHFQAHEHSYERMWPVYNLTVCNGTEENPYHNPRAPVHIVSGSAGCQELVDPFYAYPFPWSASRSDDYGYTRMTVYNSTHVYMEQVSDDQGGKVIDRLTVVKDRHGAGLYDCHKTSNKPKPELDQMVKIGPGVPNSGGRRSKGYVRNINPHVQKL